MKSIKDLIPEVLKSEWESSANGDSNYVKPDIIKNERATKKVLGDASARAGVIARFMLGKSSERE